jgi:type VI secretion system lysozyme-like protein
MSKMRQAEDLLFYRFGGRPTSSGKMGEDDSLMDDDVESVIEEVMQLLNTRSPFSASTCTALIRRSVIDYGLVDFVHLSPLNRQDVQQLAHFVRDAIVAHEPRLHVDKVVIETPRPNRDMLRAVVSGQVRKRDRSLVPVSFPVQVAAPVLG